GDEADVVDIRLDMRTRTGIAHIAAIGLGLREDALAQMSRQIVMHREGRLHQAVGLGIAGALHLARLEVLAQMLAHGVDHALQAGLLVRIDLLLGEAESVILAAEIVEELDDDPRRIAQQPVEAGAEERLEPPLQVQEEHQDGMGWPEDHHHGIAPSRMWAGRWDADALAASARMTEAAFSAIM